MREQLVQCCTNKTIYATVTNNLTQPWLLPPKCQQVQASKQRRLSVALTKLIAIDVLESLRDDHDSQHFCQNMPPSFTHVLHVTASRQRQRNGGSSTSALWSILSRYTFSRKGKTGRVLVRSSLYRFARTRDLCGPAAARMQQVTAASKANTSSCSDTYDA